MSDFDTIVVGAGAVGLACGYALGRSGRTVAILEREPRIGAGVSARNSEVIHAGLHYPTRSYKARLCVNGRRALYSFLELHHVAYNRCGKLIVACDDSDIPALERLARQAQLNGVEGVRWLTSKDAQAMEPALRCAAALESRESGVLDSHGYMFALRGEIEAAGGIIALNTPYLRAEQVSSGYAVRVGDDGDTTITARALVIAAGLGAQTCAAAIDAFPLSRIPGLHLGKGHYFSLRGVKAPFSRLVYPPPIPGALGTHYRLDLGGVAHFGPDLEFVDVEDYAVDASRAASFYDNIRRYWPALPDGALVPDYTGIRPKLHGPEDPQGDFVIEGPSEHGLEGLVCLFGIESPGLTSSLAIGDEVVARLSA
jgi:L-2-hydroxyglutarate oxidase LhgO